MSAESRRMEYPLMLSLPKDDRLFIVGPLFRETDSPNIYGSGKGTGMVVTLSY